MAKRKLPVEELKHDNQWLIDKRLEATASQSELVKYEADDYPPSLRQDAQPYFDGICKHLEQMKRLHDAVAPGAVILANMLSQIDTLTFNIAAGAADKTDIVLYKDLVALVARYSREYFLTPASLEGITIPKDKPKAVDADNRAEIRRGL